MNSEINEQYDAFDIADVTNRKAVEKMETYDRKIAQIENEGREIIRKAKAKADDQARQILDEANLKASNIMLQAEKTKIQ